MLCLHFCSSCICSYDKWLHRHVFRTEMDTLHRFLFDDMSVHKSRRCLFFSFFGFLHVRICYFSLLCMTETEYLWVWSDKRRNERVVTLLIWMCNSNLLFTIEAKFNTFSSGRQQATLRAPLSILSDFYLSFLLVSNFSTLCSTPISSLSDVSHSRTAGATLLGGV